MSYIVIYQENKIFQLLARISVFIPGFINSPYCLTFICGDLLRNFPLYCRKRQQFERAEVTEKTPLFDFEKHHFKTFQLVLC
jgi:hypothetical protein